MTVDSAELRRLVEAAGVTVRIAVFRAYSESVEYLPDDALPVLLDQLDTYQKALTGIAALGGTAIADTPQARKAWLAQAVSIARAALDTKQP